MILIIGLGNPGKEYEKTRHNLGFQVIDLIKDDFSFTDFKEFKNSLISKGLIENKEIILAKPQSFMNNSGKAVKELLNFFKLSENDIILVHDDADVDIGDIKTSQDSGSAGHKGVQSVIDELKTKNFLRIRIGINSEDLSFKNKDLEEVVLKPFSSSEQEIVDNSLKKAIEQIIYEISNR